MKNCEKFVWLSGLVLESLPLTPFGLSFLCLPVVTAPYLSCKGHLEWHLPPLDLAAFI